MGQKYGLWGLIINHMNHEEEDPLGGNEMHDLTLGDVCKVIKGKHVGKTVLIVKAGLQTKFGLRAITVEWYDNGEAGSEKVWCSPDELAYINHSDIETAERIKEADYQEWKARKNAGVPPAAAFKKKTYPKRDTRPTDTGY